ncbi:MAG: hypothetical protein ACTSQG_06955 [Promethearchaeota archaeon]
MGFISYKAAYHLKKKNAYILNLIGLIFILAIVPLILDPITFWFWFNNGCIPPFFLVSYLGGLFTVVFTFEDGYNRAIIDGKHDQKVLKILECGREGAPIEEMQTKVRIKDYQKLFRILCWSLFLFLVLEFLFGIIALVLFLIDKPFQVFFKIALINFLIAFLIGIFIYSFFQKPWKNRKAVKFRFISRIPFIQKALKIKKQKTIDFLFGNLFILSEVLLILVIITLLVPILDFIVVYLIIITFYVFISICIITILYLFVAGMNKEIRAQLFKEREKELLKKMKKEKSENINGNVDDINDRE